MCVPEQPETEPASQRKNFRSDDSASISPRTYTQNLNPDFKIICVTEKNVQMLEGPMKDLAPVDLEYVAYVSAQ